ncbi:MAG: hypothetical protein J5J00_15570 [Deltaproteobacteria bacterium]|nr:hypothetical protein [Deltaproteobacteria bacterium]
MNPAGIFTTPNGIVSYLKRRGVASLAVNKSSLEDIAECIDSGRPVIALVRSGTSPHWVTLPGYTRQVEFEGSSIKKGAILSVDVMDHCIADGCEGGRKELKAEEFMRIWSDPYGGSRVSGLLSHSRFIVELMPPEGRNNRHPSTVSNLLADTTFETVTAVHRLNPSWAKGLKNLFDK